MSKKPPKICFLKRPVPTGKVVKHKRKGGARREGLSAVERHALARELDKVFALEDCVFNNSGEWFAFLLNKREFISSVVQRNKAFVANNVEVAAFATYTTDYGLPPQFVETFCIIFLKKIISALKSLSSQPLEERKCKSTIEEAEMCVRALQSPILTACAGFDEISSQYSMEKEINYERHCSAESGEHVAAARTWPYVMVDVFTFYSGFDVLTERLSNASPFSLEVSRMLGLVAEVQESLCIHCARANVLKISESALLCIINLPKRPPYTHSQDPDQIQMALGRCLDITNDASTMDSCIQNLMQGRRRVRTETVLSFLLLSKLGFAVALANATDLPMDIVQTIVKYVGFQKHPPTINRSNRK